jgi:hypothetical protein
MMPQLDRADAEAFDGALVVAGLDVFPDPEGVIEQGRTCRPSRQAFKIPQYWVELR